MPGVRIPHRAQMKILGIETSCDETGVCIIEAEGGLNNPQFNILGDALYSQVKTHAEYGGVFPMLAKREHQKNLIPLFKKALEEAGLLCERKADEFVTARGPSVSPHSLSASAGTFDNRAVGERGTN